MRNPLENFILRSIPIYCIIMALQQKKIQQYKQKKNHIFRAKTALKARERNWKK